MEEIAAPFAGAPDGLVQALVEINRVHGFVPPQTAGALARLFNVSVADVAGTISFYSDFRQAQPAATIVRICRAEACQAVGGRALAAHAERRLGCRFGETSPDGSATLDEVYCFGNCALAPAAAIGDRLIGRATPVALDEALALASGADA